jgi:hypothetical protein
VISVAESGIGGNYQPIGVSKQAGPDRFGAGSAAKGPAAMNRFTTSLASLSIVTGLFFSAPSAYADSVTECYGGDYPRQRTVWSK